MSINGTLRTRLVLPVSSAPADDLTCVVLSDGIVMASKKWRAVKSEYTTNCGLRGQAEMNQTHYKRMVSLRRSGLYNRIRLVSVAQGQNTRTQNTKGPAC